MKRPFSTRFAALGGLLWALAPRAALAADRACPAVSIECDEAVRLRWPELVARVKDDLSTRDDLDACARVVLSLEPDASIGVMVALPDGRSASRRAMRQDDVVPTLRALLLVPKQALTEDLPPRARPMTRMSRRGRAPARAPGQQATEGRDPLGSLSADPETGLGVELSVTSGARVGDGQASFALGALSFLDFSGWLLGFEGRADKYHPLSGGAPDTALELGVLLGRRVRLPSVSLDLLAGPGVAIKGAMSDSEVIAVNMGDGTPPPPPPSPPREASSGAVPRLLVGARLGFSPRSALRTFVGLEGAFGPERAVGNLSAESPRLPRWTLGLALGATLGTR